MQTITTGTTTWNEQTNVSGRVKKLWRNYITGFFVLLILILVPLLGVSKHTFTLFCT